MVPAEFNIRKQTDSPGKLSFLAITSDIPEMQSLII